MGKLPLFDWVMFNSYVIKLPERFSTTLLGDFETFIQAAAWIRKILVNHSPVRHLNTHVFHMFGPLVPCFSIFLSCDPFFWGKPHWNGENWRNNDTHGQQWTCSQHTRYKLQRPHVVTSQSNCNLFRLVFPWNPMESNGICSLRKTPQNMFVIYRQVDLGRTSNPGLDDRPVR